jgi:flagellar basal-body rod modification protein FlgD
MNTINSNDSSQLYESLGLKTERSAQQTAQAGNSGELMQEDFLTLMTAQLKNQDPMAPMESGEFLGQMAQFGSVKGLSDLNTSFASLSESLYSNQALMASSMVGKHALVAGNSGELPADGQLRGSVDLPQSVGSLMLSITDASGQPVKQIDMGVQSAGMVDFAWDGTNSAGEMMAPGTYQVKANAISNGVNTGFETFIEGEVRSISLGAGGSKMSFDIGGIGTVSFADIQQVRK